ncbi:NADPH-dependent FMN reductase [Oricola sp.]|uniref:NADPH-dependent FMN reductase n=1 Tax=Oricola sp. TaxID=1979950 RepID=UPI0035146251
MIKLLFMSGSSRVGSANWRLVGAAAELAKRRYGDRIETTIVNLGELEIPPFDPAQADGEALPAAVAALRAEVAGCDAMFMSSDEYSGTYSALFRNSAAWLTQDIDGSGNLLEDKPVALCGVVLGGVGGLRGHPALHQFLVELGAEVHSQKLDLGTAASPFAPDGGLLPKVKRQLTGGALGSLVPETA